MSEKIIVDPQNVKAISDSIGKCLIALKKLGVQWNIAEVAVAYFHVLNIILEKVQEQKPKGVAE